MTFSVELRESKEQSIPEESFRTTMNQSPMRNFSAITVIRGV